MAGTVDPAVLGLAAPEAEALAARLARERTAVRVAVLAEAVEAATEAVRQDQVPATLMGPTAETTRQEVGAEQETLEAV